METIQEPKGRKTLFSSQSQGNLRDLRLTSEDKSKTITFGNLLATSMQERRLLSHEKAVKIWDKRNQIYSKKCHRESKSLSLMERSDQYAVKLQELDQCSKISKPCENTDAHYQWICSLRSPKGKDKKRQIFIPLSNKNPINSCVTARVNPFKKEAPVFLKISDKKTSRQEALTQRNGTARVHKLDITRTKGYIRDLKEKISQKSLRTYRRKNQFGDDPQSLKFTSPKDKDPIGFDRIENLSHLYIDGDCKFTLEYDYAKKRGTDGAQIVLDHIVDQSGVGEPDQSQEIIEEDYQACV